MIQLYTWSTPNGRKVSIALEEMGIEYETHLINIGKDDQFSPKFISISPNNKIPAIVDGEQSVFESGAILIYLARKSGKFLAPEGTTQYWKTMEWLMWQMGGFGPMLGQTHHFLHFNSGKSEYAEQRFQGEAKRLYGVLDRQLANSECVAGELSIADFAIWPWASRFDFQKLDLNDYPNVLRWYKQLAARPGFQRGYGLSDDGQSEIPEPA
ncbi:MAG: glutathione S-transferase N-terminal domain-containing protein [Granulosicoccus sp.]